MSDKVEQRKREWLSRPWSLMEIIVPSGLMSYKAFFFVWDLDCTNVRFGSVWGVVQYSKEASQSSHLLGWVGVWWSGGLHSVDDRCACQRQQRMKEGASSTPAAGIGLTVRWDRHALTARFPSVPARWRLAICHSRWSKFFLATCWRAAKSRQVTMASIESFCGYASRIKAL